MTEPSKVLVLCSFSRDGRIIARRIENNNTRLVVAQSMADAITQMRDNAFDMIIVESQIAGVSSLPLLGEARKHLPSMLRVLIETAPINIPLNEMINEISPSAIFSKNFDRDKIHELLDQKRQDIIARQIEKKSITNQSSTEQEQDFENSADEEEADMKIIAEISEAMNDMLEDPNIKLPILPEMAAKVRKLMVDDSSSFEQIADLVELEQGMSARILQVANSPIYAGLERIRNLEEAMVRLGMRETENILMAVIAQNLFLTRDRFLTKMMENLWLHSLCVAYSNEMIAKELKIVESQEFFMMGLMHDVGKLVILHLFEQGRRKKLWNKSEINMGILRKLLAMRHHDLGARLLEQWNYPQNYVEVVRLHADAQNISHHKEFVVVTFFSNILARKLGYSLVKYQQDPVVEQQIIQALNISMSKFSEFEVSVDAMTHKIRNSCFLI